LLKKIYYFLPYYLQNIITRLSNVLHNDIIDDFINFDYGKDYNVTKNLRLSILHRLQISLSQVEAATSLKTQVILIKKILSIKKKKNLCIVECGCFKGSSTIALSIAAKIIGAKLIIYDSFEGLPSSEKSMGPRSYPHLNLYGYYRKGMYKGQLAEVIRNISIFGEISVCEFRKGLFETVLKKHKEKIQFLFLDVDLTTSTKSCIKYLWKKLDDNSYVYTDDACDLKVVSVWFDNQWWRKNLNETAPGFVGSGCGLPISGNYSGLGYVYKKKFKLKNLSSSINISWLHQ